jgi:hypothetical protein
VSQPGDDEPEAADSLFGRCKIGRVTSGTTWRAVHGWKPKRRAMTAACLMWSGLLLFEEFDATTQ